MRLCSVWDAGKCYSQLSLGGQGPVRSQWPLSTVSIPPAQTTSHRQQFTTGFPNAGSGTDSHSHSERLRTPPHIAPPTFVQLYVSSLI